MKGRDALMSSVRQDWETPGAFFEKLNAEFNFTLDAAATAENRKCDLFISPEEDAFVTPWDAGGDGAIWLNPPYDEKVQTAFLQRAYEESKRTGRTVVILIPARTDTHRWHHIVFPLATEIRFVKGRLTFVGAPSTSTMPSALVIFGPMRFATVRYR